MSKMNGVSIYAAYQEALMRIKNGSWDYRDRVIVDQWETGSRVSNEKKQLQAEVDRLNKIIRTLTYCNDVNDSRVNPNAIMPGLESYLKGINPARWSQTDATQLLH